MTRTLVPNAIAALLALTLLAAPAASLPQDQTVFTSFEEIDPNTAVGELIVVGVWPNSANLTGDAFAGVIGDFSLYHSGLKSWMVVTNGTGVISFEIDAAVVEFYAKVLSLAMRSTVITAFDAFGVIVGAPVTVSPGTGWQLISLSGAIARIEVENLDKRQMNAIDDFGFTPVPDPDGDGIDSPFDNCSLRANPAQDDTDADGCGNLCDADYAQSGTVSIADFGRFALCFGTPDEICQHAEPIGGRLVGIGDFGFFVNSFAIVPGPSGTTSGTKACP